MEYGDYIGNVTRVAVELANEGGVAEPSALMRQMFDEHRVAGLGGDSGNGDGSPGGGGTAGAPALGRLPELVGVALGELVGHGDLGAVSTLLSAYPPDLHLSDHDGRWHIHFARDGETAEAWLGRTVAAALAHVAAGDPGVTLGRCAAEGCGRYFVDQSRNRTRRFCGNACASRTTVAAYRARAKG